jgi:hypothetical protein
MPEAISFKKTHISVIGDNLNLNEANKLALTDNRLSPIISRASIFPSVYSVARVVVFPSVLLVLKLLIYKSRLKQLSLQRFALEP